MILSLMRCWGRHLVGLLPAPAREVVRFELLCAWSRWRAKECPLPVSGPVLLNLGCGSRSVPGFVNIDFFQGGGIDFAADLRHPLRIADNMVDGIFTEHMLEHLSFEEAGRLLEECHRVLKPGGALRVLVPDVGLFLHHFAQKDSNWFRDFEEVFFSASDQEDRRQRRLATPLQAISFVTQEDGHRSCWDMETLTVLLERAGFSQIEKTAFRQGGCDSLLIDADDPGRRMITLYVEAWK